MNYVYHAHSSTRAAAYGLNLGEIHPHAILGHYMSQKVNIRHEEFTLLAIHNQPVCSQLSKYQSQMCSMLCLVLQIHNHIIEESSHKSPILFENSIHHTIECDRRICQTKRHH